MRKFLLIAMCSVLFTTIASLKVSCFTQQGIDPVDKILVLNEIADAQIEEIKFASGNKPDEVPGLVRAYEITVQAIQDSSNQITTEVDLTEVLEVVSAATVKHTEVLKALLDQVPEEAIPAIKHAIEVSTTGRETALDRLQKIQERKIPKGKPKGVEESGKPEGIRGSGKDGKPCGQGRPGG